MRPCSGCGNDVGDDNCDGVGDVNCDGVGDGVGDCDGGGGMTVVVMLVGWCML